MPINLTCQSNGVINQLYS